MPGVTHDSANLGLQIGHSMDEEEGVCSVACLSWHAGDRAAGHPRKKPASDDAGFSMTKRLRQYAATGLPGEPVAPTSFSGAQENRNS